MFFQNIFRNISTQARKFYAFAASSIGNLLNNRKSKSRLANRNISNRTVPGRTSSGTKQNIKSRGIFSKKNKIIAAVSFIIFALIFTWYTFAIAPTIRISAESVTSTIIKEEQAVATYGATSGIIALSKVQTESGSDSIPTTGIGKKGNPATGIVKAAYLQASGTLTIPAGSIMTCSNISDCGGKPLTFKTLNKYTLTFTTGADMTIQSTDIGADYNLKPGIKFVINGISPSDLNLINTAAFTGGSSQDIKIVAQSDIDTLKTKLTSTLKDTASSEVAAAFGPDFEILKDAIKTNVKNVTTDKKVNDEADTLNMNMDLEITASGYNKTTVRPEAEKLLRFEEKDNLKLDLQTMDIKQTIAKSDATGITIQLNITGTLKPIIDKDKIRSDLLGKSLDDINKYFANIPNVKNVNYTYQPSWAFGFLKHIPNSANSINIEFQQVGK